MVNHNRIKRQHQAARYHFVITELDLAITFSEIALAADDRGKSDRNEQNARRAQSAAKHFLRNACFSQEMGQEVDWRLALVARLLGQIENGRSLR